MTTFPADPAYGFGPATIVRGDARHLPLADDSVDLIVTSPPYFALRSYQDGGEHYRGQIGGEKTPGEFVDALIECTREMMRVLKPTGSCWLNLGDKYSTGTSGDRNNGFNERIGNAPGKRAQERSQIRSQPAVGFQSKTLLGIPWRYALRCIDDLGLILRAEVIWSKPNGLPESVTDRVRRSHEQWFHMVKQPRYFSAVDEIREPSNPANVRPQDRRGEQSAKDSTRRANGHGAVGHAGVPLEFNPLGKLPGSVREVASQPLKVPAELGVDHFAAFPPAWPAWIIRGWSPTGICTGCGEGRRPVVRKALQVRQRHLGDRQDRNHDNQWGTSWRELGGATEATITGYSCVCPTPDAPTRPAVVLDPFGGTGTTAMAARALGRHGISVDLSADYCRLAAWRVDDSVELASVRGLQRKAYADRDSSELSLFDLVEDAS